MKPLLIADGLLECDVQEQLIGETCFLYNVEAQHDASSSLCKKISKDYTYDLHKVTSRFEQKWISSTFPSYSAIYQLHVKNNCIIEYYLKALKLAKVAQCT